MANLERGFRRLTLAASILLMLPFLVATIPSFLARDGPATLFGLGLTVSSCRGSCSSWAVGLPEGSAIEEDAASVERLSPARQVPTCSLTPCITLGCSR